MKIEQLKEIVNREASGAEAVVVAIRHFDALLDIAGCLEHALLLGYLGGGSTEMWARNVLEELEKIE